MRHDDYTTVSAAAKQFGISARHLRSLLQQGVIEGVKPSRDWLVRPSAVAEYLRRGVRPGPRPRRPPTEYQPKLQPKAVVMDAPAGREATVPEAAKLIGMSTSQVRHLLRANLVYGRKVGRDWVVSVDDLLSYRRRVRLGRPPGN